ncbi:MAG: EamA family transporter [Coriobacteriales bacterium]|jgi:drug/metabolite transporter (DMT)-like permease|nr:EamA family transporter [Coriobacteriales bacterium]
MGTLSEQRRALVLAGIATLAFSLSTPGNKLLMGGLPPVLLAALMYLGACLWAGLAKLWERWRGKTRLETPLMKEDRAPFLGILIGDTVAPVCYMVGLSMTSPANSSLLHNFEFVTTALFAMLFFKEAIGGRLWVAIATITAGSILLTWEGFEAFSFNPGSLMVLLSACIWGLTNNLSRMISVKDPLQIVMIKSAFTGLGALSLSLVLGEKVLSPEYVPLGLLLGAISFGLGNYLVIRVQRGVGAARASAYTSFAPFISALLSFVIFRDRLTVAFALALGLIAAGVYLAVFERHEHLHTHEPQTHDHRHRHDDEHHLHSHEPVCIGEHSHLHTHEQLIHRHPHKPDIHHRHQHQRRARQPGQPH